MTESPRPSAINPQPLDRLKELLAADKDGVKAAVNRSTEEQMAAAHSFTYLVRSVLFGSLADDVIGEIRESHVIFGKMCILAALHVTDQLALLTSPSSSGIRAQEPEPYAYLADAKAIVESPTVIGTYASCEWDELDDNGKLWIAAIVRETVARSEARSLSSKPIDHHRQQASGEAPPKMEVYGYERVCDEETGREGMVPLYRPASQASGEAPGMTDLMVAPESIPDDLGHGDPSVGREAGQ